MRQPRRYIPVHIPLSMRWLRGAIDRLCERTGKSAGTLFREAFCEQFKGEDTELGEKWRAYKELNEDE